MKRMFLFISIFIVMICFFTLDNAYSKVCNKPIMVISTISASRGSTKGELVPAITVYADGIWKEAVLKDAFKGQKYKLYFENKEHCLKMTSKEITVETVDEDYGRFVNNIDERLYYGVYSNTSRYTINSKEELIKFKDIDNSLQKTLQQRQPNNKFLQLVVKKDIKNICKDFSTELKPSVNDVMMGDLDGDNKTDYFLIVGETSYGSFNSEAAAVIGYVSNKGKYVRVPFMIWENTTEDQGWPQLFFTHDFNGDGKEEVFIADADSDTSRPIVFSWFNNGVKIIYYSEREWWFG